MDIRGWSTGLLNTFHHTGFTFKSKLRNLINQQKDEHLEGGTQQPSNQPEQDQSEQKHPLPSLYPTTTTSPQQRTTDLSKTSQHQENQENQERAQTKVEVEDNDALRSSSTKQDESHNESIMVDAVNAATTVAARRSIHNLFRKHATQHIKDRDNGIDLAAFQQMLKYLGEKYNAHNAIDNSSNVQKWFEMMDSNHDGVLSEQEFEKSYHQIPRLHTFIQMWIDKDKKDKKEKKRKRKR